MSTEFMSMLPPPGTAISHYDRTVPHDSQHNQHIPQTFLEAMSIREAVFVNEQKVPLENELDEDDARSYHWVTYVSVGNSASHPSAQDANGKRGSTASRLAVGTVRLVPPPHPPHIHQGAEHKIDNGEASDPTLRRRGSSNPAPPPTASSFNPHNEPYAKVGRLAVLPTFRKLGLAKLLMDTALSWAAKHPADVVPPLSGADREARKMEGESDEMVEKWKGLVLVHAQRSIEHLYKKWGWERDEAMGEWDEEGIMHVAMWKRVHVHTNQ